MGDSNETQEKILAASLALFADKGYHGTRTSEIARDSGVAEATIFKYFRSKKNLLSAVLEKIIADILPEIAFSTVVDWERIQDPLKGRPYLKEVLLEKISQVRQNFSAFRVIVTELQYHEDLKQIYLKQLMPNVIRMLEGFYEQGLAAGAFRPVDGHIAARCFVGSLVLMIVEDRVLKRDIDFSRDLDTILDIFQRGIGTQAEEENHA